MVFISHRHKFSHKVLPLRKIHSVADNCSWKQTCVGAGSLEVQRVPSLDEDKKDFPMFCLAEIWIFLVVVPCTEFSQCQYVYPTIYLPFGKHVSADLHVRVVRRFPVWRCNRTSSSLYSRSQWPSGLRRRSTTVRLLGSWVRIPPGAWAFVCCECCVWSGRGLCDELAPRPGKSYRLWCVVVC